MMKIAIPVLLVSIVMIAGIFAFMPVDKASTVHTTIQSTIQNTQLNNIASTFQTDLSANATATCGSGSSFLVYWTFTNGTLVPSTSEIVLGIFDGIGNNEDIAIELANQTSVSGVIGGAAGTTITFFGNSTGPTSGVATLEDVGDISVTVLCRSTDSASVSP